MSSDSDDEPLSVLKARKRRSPGPLPTTVKSEEKPRKTKKKTKQKLKKVIRPASDGRKCRYYASQAPVERPHDVWLYMKDLNAMGPYSCLLCNEWFINKSKLVIHYILNHKKDFCGICRYFVDNREAWTEHLKYHVPIQCSQCSEQVDNEFALRSHFIEKHGCVYCRLCSFMVLADQYNIHLYQKHAVSDVANRDSQTVWDTEYEGSPQFSCLFCLKCDIAAIDFYKHYMCTHRMTLKCFSVMLSGLDVPFSVYGANISNRFLENALKNHAKVGYVDRDGDFAESKINSAQEIGHLDGSVNLQVLIPEIKQEQHSDAEGKDEVEELSVEADAHEPCTEDAPKPKKVRDPILDYKGTEDVDITLTEIVFLNKCYVEYLDAAVVKDPTVLPVQTKILYKSPDDEEIPCTLCPEKFTNQQTFTSHMMKTHCVRQTDAYFCRVCVATFDSEAEYRTHLMEETAEFDDLWLCQFCDVEFDGRENARCHLSEHWDEIKADNCFSPQLGLKCRYCPTLFWTEMEREGHHKYVHYEKHKKDFYKCTGCDDVYSDKVWFTHHYTRVHGDAVYVMKCSVCCLVFPTMERVIEHFGSDHPEARKIFCSLGVCRYKPFSQSKSFKMHIQTYHGQNSRPQTGATCEVCGREFSTLRACNAHAALAHGPGRFKCQLCPEMLQSQDERRLHVLLQHPGRRPYNCVHCNKSFLHKSSLYMHKSYHEGTAGDLKCKHCGKQFAKKDSFREHLLIHEGPRHACSYCPMRFVQRSNMLRHERRHTGERPYTCTTCGRSFSDKGACNSHMRVHGPHEAYPCPYCGRAYSLKTKLRYHMRRHTGEHMVNCHVCGKLFPSQSDLNTHLRTHEDRDPVDCPACGKMFSTKRLLKRHMGTHHVDRADQLSCPLCDSKATCLATLRHHVLTHSDVKHVRCHLCSKSYSSQRSIVKHLNQKHRKTGTVDQLRHLFTALDPRECGLGLEEDAILTIFGPRKTQREVLIGDYVTLRDVPVKPEAFEDGENEQSDDEEDVPLEDEQPIAEELVTKQKKITYKYEDIEIDIKNKKIKEKKIKEEITNPESEVGQGSEAAIFVSIKAEPMSD